MANERCGEPVTLEHREWARDGTHVLTLFHRPGWPNDAWQIRHHHAYEGGGGFGYNSSFDNETEARAYFATKAVEEDARHAEWLAGEIAKGA